MTNPTLPPPAVTPSAVTDQARRGVTRRNNGLKENTLGVPSIVFYIIAAASPLTVVVGLFPS